jgi:hypothetical protein
MRRRGLLLGVGALALIGLGAFAHIYFHALWSGEGITEENCERIQLGMTEAEVEAIFGCPAGNYSGKKVDKLANLVRLLKVVEENDTDHISRVWVGNDVAILVTFGSGRVVFFQLESFANHKDP